MPKTIIVNNKIYTGINKVRIRIPNSDEYHEFIVTDDADALLSDIIAGKTAYVANTKVVGVAVTSQQLFSPTVTNINPTISSVSFTITNNAVVPLVIKYGITEGMLQNVSLAGNNSTVVTISGLSAGTSYNIYMKGFIDDVSVTDLVTMNFMTKDQTFLITNKLDGSTLNSSYSFYYSETLFHQYIFEDGVPISVTLNGTTSSTMVEETITTSGSQYVKVRAYVDGRITLFGNGDDIGGTVQSGELQCSISFNTGTSSDIDSFKIRGYIDICLIAGTLIKTPTGYIKIEDIKPDDIVLTYDIESQSIRETYIDEFYLQNGCRSIRKITLSNGAVIGATPVHSFYTLEGWKCCEPNEHLVVQDRLVVGDKFKTYDGDIVEVIRIEEDLEPQPIYHIVLTEGNTFFVTNNEEYSPIISEHYYKYDEDLIAGVGRYPF